MLLLEKHGTRHHEASWLIEGKLYSVILHARRGPDPRKRAERDVQYPGKGVGVPEQEQDMGREKTQVTHQ